MLKPYQAVRIMTGAMIPEGADCVVKQEDAEWDERAVRIYHNAKPGENYCPAGEDFSAGDLLAEAGTPVDSYLLAAVTAAGVRNLTVYKRLKAAVITTVMNYRIRRHHCSRENLRCEWNLVVYKAKRDGLRGSTVSDSRR